MRKRIKILKHFCGWVCRIGCLDTICCGRVCVGHVAAMVLGRVCIIEICVWGFCYDLWCLRNMQCNSVKKSCIF